MVATGPLAYPRRGAGASEDEIKTFRRQQAREGLELRGWWIGEMLSTPSPLTERMTLFWHNHFATSNSKVQNARLMLGQYELMRRHDVAWPRRHAHQRVVLGDDRT
jgi:uncharacterized protein (DUF1800 family)